jgi:hypothetical protein
MPLITIGGKAITLFTFKFMEDTGWYRLANIQPDLLNWGHKKGCDFYNNDCSISKNHFEEYC